jgi:hypothetical protein
LCWLENKEKNGTKLQLKNQKAQTGFACASRLLLEDWF